MKNQVIKVLTQEHGRKVIEYWKSKGVDTRNMWGFSCEANNNECIYYGVINGVFDNYRMDQISDDDKVEIIELPKEEFDLTTNEGRLAYAMAYAKKHYPNNRAKIIKEDPKQEEKVMETQKLSRQGLKEIHGVACSYWKGKLQGMGIRNPLEDYIELTQEEVDNMFKACTKEQLPIVSKYLKQDDGSVDLSNGDNGLIAVRLDYEYANKSFWLSPSYDWDIKEDSFGYKCLIPTKKKK
jgi:hypothetical protein